jgi:hypothetical protein
MAAAALRVVQKFHLCCLVRVAFRGSAGEGVTGLHFALTSADLRAGKTAPRRH